MKKFLSLIPLYIILYTFFFLPPIAFADPTCDQAGENCCFFPPNSYDCDRALNPDLVCGSNNLCINAIVPPCIIRECTSASQCVDDAADGNVDCYVNCVPQGGSWGCTSTAPPSTGNCDQAGAACCSGSPNYCFWPYKCQTANNICYSELCSLSYGECVLPSQCNSGCQIAIPPGGFQDCFGSTVCCDRQQNTDLHCTLPVFCQTSSNQPGVKTPIGCLPYIDAGLNPASAGRAMITALIGWFMSMAGVVFLLLIVYGAFLLTTGGGDTKKIQSGKEIVSAGIAGMVLIVLTLTILNFLGLHVLNLGPFGFNV